MDHREGDESSRAADPSPEAQRRSLSLRQPDQTISTASAPVRPLPLRPTLSSGSESGGTCTRSSARPLETLSYTVRENVPNTRLSRPLKFIHMLPPLPPPPRNTETSDLEYFCDPLDSDLFRGSRRRLRGSNKDAQNKKRQARPARPPSRRF